MSCAPGVGFYYPMLWNNGGDERLGYVSGEVGRRVIEGKLVCEPGGCSSYVHLP